MAKKIKSFTVDEDVYNRLVAMFKKYGAKTSISMYLSNQVKFLLERLEDLESGMKEIRNTVPMSYIIDETVKGSGRSGILSGVYYDDSPISELDMALEHWQESYEAYQECIPYEYYVWVKMGGYVLSRDKKFIINKETGKKYISKGRNELMEVHEIGLKNERSSGMDND